MCTSIQADGGGVCRTGSARCGRRSARRKMTRKRGAPRNTPSVSYFWKKETEELPPLPFFICRLSDMTGLIRQSCRNRYTVIKNTLCLLIRTCTSKAILLSIDEFDQSLGGVFNAQSTTKNWLPRNTYFIYSRVLTFSAALPNQVKRECRIRASSKSTNLQQKTTKS